MAKAASERRKRASSNARPADRREALRERYGKVAGAVGPVAKQSGTELFAVGRELIRLPADMYVGLAERLGAYVLVVWLWLWPYLVRTWRLAAAALVWAQGAVTPARATMAAALACAAALAGSQWADLSQITVGTAAYAEVEDVVLAPPVSEKTVGSAHSWLGVPLALAAALVVLRSARRPKLARLLIPLGAAVIAISLLVDRPEGLDEGRAAIAYESVSAELLPGFWAQLVSGAVLILLAPVLLRVLPAARPESKPRSPADRETLLSGVRPRRPAEEGR